MVNEAFPDDGKLREVGIDKDLKVGAVVSVRITASRFLVKQGVLPKGLDKYLIQLH